MSEFIRSFLVPSMAATRLGKWRWMRRGFLAFARTRSFRSDAALEAISKASEKKIPNLVLYNYPSFSGAFSALFAHLFHTHLGLPCLVLPFSSVVPFRIEDICIDRLETCYLLDFLGPKGFAVNLSQQAKLQVIGFDHRKSSIPQIPFDLPQNLSFRVNLEKSSSIAVYEYFSSRLSNGKYPSTEEFVPSLLDPKDRNRVETVLKYIEDGDLHRRTLPDAKAFDIGLKELSSKLNCLTNPHMYEQLLKISSLELIAKGHAYTSSRQNAARELLNEVFIIRLGRGFYGECLGVRADANSKLSDEIGKLLSIKSAAAGLRPIGAVIYMQRNNLKMCLRSTDSTIDTSEVAKAYGGGGTPSSSSFIIRMDEYNRWLSPYTS